MKPAELNASMHAVLDGEATPDEARELERALAADPAARHRFEEWRELWDGLGRIELAYPPEGLVANVMADLPHGRPEADDDQLFPPSGVIAASSKESRVISRGTSTTVRATTQTGPFFRGESMISKRSKVWIGVAVAVAAIAVGSQFVNYPPRGDEAAGTIAPAQRYRAPQATEGVNVVGGPSGSASTQAGAAAGEAAGNAAGNAANNASSNAANNASSNAANNAS